MSVRSRRSGKSKRAAPYVERKFAERTARTPARGSQSEMPGPGRGNTKQSALRYLSGSNTAVQSRMSKLFGVPLHDVAVRTDRHAAAKAAQAGARAYSDG